MTDQAKPIVVKGEFVVGTVIPYGSRINASSLEQQGWLFCDGSLVSRQNYAELFAVIGTLHGGGDGIHTFNLPDYRGRFQRGVDDGAGRDPDVLTRQPAASGGMPGDECGSVQDYATAMPGTKFTMTTDGQHSHTISHIPNDYSSYPFLGSYQAIWNEGVVNTKSAGSHTHTLGGGDAETRPVNAYVNFLIKYKPG